VGRHDIGMGTVPTCSRCGLCCTSKRGDRLVFCEYLDRIAVGEPNGTRCRVYESRSHLMPIRMLYADGEFVRQTRCVTIEPDHLNILQDKGLESRCSLLSTLET
jgi:hypothetical protein